MAPTLTTYLYPWDLVRLGVDEVLDDLSELGITAVNLTATYHAISAMSPRGVNPGVFFSPRGGVFFPARSNRYGEVKPAVWPDKQVTHAWALLAERAVRKGFALNAWTIAMFQPWMAQDYPSAARVLATGDRSDTGVCPNNSAVQEYLATLAVDLADQFPIRHFVLEGIGIPEFNYGWVRPRVLADFSGLAKAILKMCFCERCVEVAASKGIQASNVRQQVLDLVSRYRLRDDERAIPSIREILDANEDLGAYSLIGTDGATSVVRVMAEALRSRHLTAGILVPNSGAGGSNEASLAQVREDIAGLNVWAAVMSSEVQASYLVDLRKQEPDLVIDLVISPPLDPNAPTVLMMPSFDYSDAGFLSRVEEVVAFHPDEISIYHYSLLDDAAFRRIVELVQ